MDHELGPEEVRTLWLSQELDQPKISIDDLRRRSSSFGAQIRRRNSLEYAAIALVVVYFGVSIVRVPDLLMRMGMGLSIAGGLYVACQLWKRGSPAKTLPAEHAVAPWLEFRRRELERQRDLLRDCWRWYLGPFIPGLVVIGIAGILRNPQMRMRLFIGAWAAATAAFFFWVNARNQRCARNLDRQIHELENL